MKSKRQMVSVSVCALVSAVLLVCAPLSRADSDLETPVADKWALVVGVSQYKNPAISPLSYAAKDASDFADYLVKEAHFAPDHVKVLCNEKATQKQILSELGSRWLPRVAAPDDLVVIFVSSHGSPADMDVQGVNYIVAHDSDPDDLYTTAIEMQDLVSTVSRRVHSKRLVVFLDSCHSGAAANTGSKGMKRVKSIDVSKVPLGNGQIVISSSQSDQVSWELKDKPNGAFTHCLLNVLRHQKDSPVPQVFDSLQDSVQQTVLRERGALQTPVLKSNWKGKVVSLDVVPTRPHPGLDDNAPNSTALPGSATDPNPSLPSAVVSLPTQPATTTPVTTVNVGHVQKSSLPDSIAILPVTPVKRTNIQPIPPTMKVLWGQLKSAQELVSLPTKMAEGMFRGLRSKFSTHVLGPHSVNAALSENQLSPNTGSWVETDWKRAGEALQAKYLVAASIDQVDWSTSMMANKYTMIVSARLMSGDTGRVISEVKALQIKKAPFQGDVGGARQYLENTVAPSAAKEVAEEFISALRKDGLSKDKD